MRLKLHILFFLVVLTTHSTLLGFEKFLHVTGELVDENTKEPLLNFDIKQVEDELDSLTTHFDKTEFDLWVSPNRETILYFIKDGYVLNFMVINASFIPSIAYKKKQKIELVIKMNKATDRMKVAKKPSYIAEYVAKINGFEVTDMSLKKNQTVSPEYKPPFPSPADTYQQVKPTSKSLVLTKEVDKKKTKGNSGIASIMQGILFADLNYCLFNERTNDANIFLTQLQEADFETWGSVKTFDSPEYGRIVTRTLNREQSIDTLFALGAHLETSRLIYQDFTSDSKVLIHLKTLKNVLDNFVVSSASPEVNEFMDALYELKPFISHLEETYKDLLAKKLNFEMHEDDNFKKIKEMTDNIYSNITHFG
ncbi:MAG: hypothetical protein R2780_00325 [Crocinitomicaceae bacterium]|nr:hypothetical protein [Crocinitomicaceae bacterium]